MTSTIEAPTFKDPDAVFNENRSASDPRPGETGIEAKDIIQPGLGIPDGKSRDPLFYDDSTPTLGMELRMRKPTLIEPKKPVDSTEQAPVATVKPQSPEVSPQP